VEGSVESTFGVAAIFVADSDSRCVDCDAHHGSATSTAATTSSSCSCASGTWKVPRWCCSDLRRRQRFSLRRLRRSSRQCDVNCGNDVFVEQLCVGTWKVVPRWCCSDLRRRQRFSLRFDVDAQRFCPVRLWRGRCNRTIAERLLAR
jgi:hypothetical protein